MRHLTVSFRTPRSAWVLAVLVALLLVGSQAEATVITFDDVTTGTESLIPNGYSGLLWNNFYVFDGTLMYPGSGYDNGTVTEDYVALNGNPNPAAFSDAPFTFNGCYLTAAWNEDLNIQVEGFLDDTLLFSETVVVDPYEPTWFDFNFTGINRVVFTSWGGTDAGLGGGGTYFAMDNLTINESSAAIPEPSSMALLALGGLGLLRRRRGRA